MQMPSFSNYHTKRSWSQPSTPALYELHPSKDKKPYSLAPSTEYLLTHQYNSTISMEKNCTILKHDLLKAADSVTNAMQNLLQELQLEDNVNNCKEDEQIKLDGLNELNSLGSNNFFKENTSFNNLEEYSKSLSECELQRTRRNHQNFDLNLHNNSFYPK